MIERRHIIGVYDFGLREFAEGLKIAVKKTRPAIGCGLFDDLALSGLRNTLCNEGNIFTVVMRGKDAPEWSTLDAAQRSESITPFGVVVLKGEADVWERLAKYTRISFVIDADKTKPTAELESLFPHLAATTRLASVSHAEIPEILDMLAMNTLEPLPGPYH